MNEFESELAEVIEPITLKELSALRIDTRRFTIGEIVDGMNRGQWKTRKDFFPLQGSTWSLIAQSRWIESILLALPLPPIWAGMQENGHWIVYDGEARLQACKSFMHNSFELRGLPFLPQHEGLCYEDLSLAVQRKILESRMIMHTVERGSQQARYAIIRRLQTNSAVFTDQMALYLSNLL
jgi:hypothetical protein